MTLLEFGISSGRVKGLTGVWVDIDTNKPKKICAMGVKSSRWVTMHGLALNVSTDLNYFNNIIPCGINDKEVTSIENELNKKIKLEEVENKMLKNLEDVFKFKLKKDKVWKRKKRNITIKKKPSQELLIMLKKDFVLYQ